MAVQLIKIGNTANDGTGDDLREAFVKVNANFNELDLRDDEQTTVSNLGATGEGIFKEKINYDLKFKKLVAGSNVTLTATDDNITIATPDTGLQQLTVTAGTGNIVLQNTAALTIAGGTGISTAISGTTLTITNTAPAELASDTTPVLGGNLDAGGFNIANAGTITSTGFTGNLTGNVTGLVNGVDPATKNDVFENMDFGNFTITVANFIDYHFRVLDIELGSIPIPNEVEIDFGALAV